MKIKIIQPGLLTTVQDSGRFGLAHLGVPCAGFMDEPSAALANHMVNNSTDEGLLELTWTGIEFKSEAACSVALAGAEFDVSVNGARVSTDAVIHLQAGDVFKMEKLRTGVRAYLAFAGGLAIDSMASSVSTLMVAQLGGYKGRKLQSGDVLFLKKPTTLPNNKKPGWKKLKTPSLHVIRATLGPEFNLFSTETCRQALGQAYYLTQDCNRQGFRLQGETISFPENYGMISSGLVPGSLQVTPDGQTILAMKDAQTTGGYPRILVVNQDELHKLAQIRPNQPIYFFVEHQ
ncbi:biotin-dependent carboxyltransferase family protein [Marinicella litoralis]|uniref:Antagonist of KipI n=1 Tax=Marinicella litoralis TaxID=644220 RepID=A0A4R6XM55_9GAMM|nr:biotin-dependent carboxyltransferase family protein [Marinicella litoralis]TDR19439.1 antagonist of KipI [Marinicella litoralis]